MGKVTILMISLLLAGGRVFSQPSGTAATGSHTAAYLFVQLPASVQKNSTPINRPEMSSYFDLMGWLGTFFYILAYLLLTLRKIRSQQKIYHLLNILGALGLIANALHLRDMPSLVVNIVWFGIGLLAIGWMVFRKKEKVS